MRNELTEFDLAELCSAFYRWAVYMFAIAIVSMGGCSGAPSSADNAASTSKETTTQSEGTAKTPVAKDVSAKHGQPPVAGPPVHPFLETAKDCGIDYIHFNGTTGEYYLPEITGAGAALLDYDNDGDLDVYLVQGAILRETENPKAARWDGDAPPRDRLFRNDMGDGADPPLLFTDVTESCGIEAEGYGMGVATGDFDNDGWVDLYVTNLGSNQLFRNNGDGTFSDVTEASGCDDPRWSTSATFFDYDRDGWLDLFVAGYVDFSVDMKRHCYAASSARDYCGPDTYDPIVDRLFHNNGDGTFDDVTATSGINQTFGAGLAVCAADLNGDGWTDLYVANDGDPNQLWINEQGNGKFHDGALLAGLAYNHMGLAEAGMGVEVGDLDGDGDEDVFVTHLERESNTLYVNVGDGMFEDRTIQMGLHAASLRYTAFGTGMLDYDNDGWLDLIVLNGAVRIMEPLARKGDPYPLHQTNQLFHNEGRANFADVTRNAGLAFKTSRVSRGAAMGDVDNDGDTDVVVLNNNGNAELLLNQVGNRQHWVGIRVVDSLGRDATQSRIEVIRPKKQSIWRRVHTDGSYCSAGDPRMVVGLGKHDQSVTVRLHAARGKSEEFTDLAVDRYWLIQPGQPAKEMQRALNGSTTR